MQALELIKYAFPPCPLTTTEHLFHIIQYNIKAEFSDEFWEQMEVDQFAELFEPLLDVEFLLAGNVASQNFHDHDTSPPRGMAFRTAAVLVAAAILLDGPTTEPVVEAIAKYAFPNQFEMHAEVKSYAEGILDASHLRR